MFGDDFPLHFSPIAFHWEHVLWVCSLNYSIAAFLKPWWRVRIGDRKGYLNPALNSLSSALLNWLNKYGLLKFLRWPSYKRKNKERGSKDADIDAHPVCFQDCVKHHWKSVPLMVPKATLCQKISKHFSILASHEVMSIFWKTLVSQE